jgi:hypothetical protein
MWHFWSRMVTSSSCSPTSNQSARRVPTLWPPRNRQAARIHGGTHGYGHRGTSREAFRNGCAHRATLQIVGATNKRLTPAAGHVAEVRHGDNSTGVGGASIRHDRDREIRAGLRGCGRADENGREDWPTQARRPKARSKSAAAEWASRDAPSWPSFPLSWCLLLRQPTPRHGALWPTPRSDTATSIRLSPCRCGTRTSGAKGRDRHGWLRG